MVGQATAHILGTRKQSDPDPWFIREIGDHFWQNYQDTGQDSLEFAIPGSRIRASWAGMCARRIAYEVAGVEVSNPTTVVDAWRFQSGTLVHEAVQAIIEKRFPGSVSEYKVRIGRHGSGHIDIYLVITDPETNEVVKRIVVEIKTINGFGFKRMFGRDGEGPRYSGVVQAALNAASMDQPVDEVLVAVFSLETISPGEAAKLGIKSEYARFGAQWTYTRPEFELLAQEELARLERIVEIVDRSGVELVPRIVPDPHLPAHMVVNPAKGIIEVRNDLGVVVGQRTTWHCLYCPFQSHCADSYVKEEEAKLATLLERSIQMAKDGLGAEEVDG